LHKRWAAEQRWIDRFTDPTAYDWVASRRAWYFQAYSLSAQARVFVEKSPPFLLVVDRLVEHFDNARFLFMVRDPYAVVEGVLRKSRSASGNAVPSAADVDRAANHVMNCLRWQQRNVTAWCDRGAFFSYETMCADPAHAEGLIKRLVPTLDDVTLRRRLRIREYDELLRNMNDQQIARLDVDERKRVNDVFGRHRDVLEFFGYPLRD
jgi:hypothetical protein